MKRILVLLFKLPDFLPFIKHYGYLGLLIWLLTFNHIAPLPDELTMLTVGYLAGNHLLNPILSVIVATAGLVIVDTVYYFLARSGSNLVKNKLPKVKSELLESYRNNLKNRMFPTLLILCFIPKMRIISPITCGTMKLPYFKFILYEFISIVLFTTIYIVLGIIFKDSVTYLLQKIKASHTAILVISICLAAAFLTGVVIVLWRARKKKRRKRK